MTSQHRTNSRAKRILAADETKRATRRRRQRQTGIPAGIDPATRLAAIKTAAQQRKSANEKG